MLSSRIQEELSGWLSALRQVGTYEGGGLWRQPYTQADRTAKDMLRGWMQNFGLVVREDGIGNLFGRLEGREAGPAILSGSHIDSVRAGGHLDGALGVLAPLAALGELVRVHGSRGSRSRS